MIGKQADDSSELRADWLHTACVWEVSARKAGNVHPQAAYSDLTWQDFLQSAGLLRNYYRHAPSPWQARGAVSTAILENARLVQQQVGRNTNLGILLLLAPLAAVPLEQTLSAGISEILNSLDADDTARVYAAIRLMQPGGLGEVETADVNKAHEAPAMPLKAVMELAQERDLIARQYANNFADVLGFGRERLLYWQDRSEEVEQFASRSVANSLLTPECETMVVGLHLEWLAQFPDSLIARKLGAEFARQVSDRASAVLSADWPRHPQARQMFVDFDLWLRADGNRRNPGTSADLVAATLFAALREGLLKTDS